MEHHILPVKTYLIIFGLLMLLMTLTIVAAFFNFGALSLPIALTIAAAKAILVILFFMHIKFEGRLMAIFSVTGFFFLLILITFTIGDYIARDTSLSPSTYAIPFDRLEGGVSER
jgi:cytochrome c oxidase subunit 4